MHRFDIEFPLPKQYEPPDRMREVADGYLLGLIEIEEARDLLRPTAAEMLGLPVDDTVLSLTRYGVLRHDKDNDHLFDIDAKGWFGTPYDAQNHIVREPLQAMDAGPAGHYSHYNPYQFTAGIVSLDIPDGVTDELDAIAWADDKIRENPLSIFNQYPKALIDLNDAQRHEAGIKLNSNFLQTDTAVASDIVSIGPRVKTVMRRLPRPEPRNEHQRSATVSFMQRPDRSKPVRPARSYTVTAADPQKTSG